MIAWMVSGIEPQGVVPLLPEGPWHRMISRMTEIDVRDRLPDMNAVLDELAAVRTLMCAEKRIVLTDVEAAALIAILAGATEDGAGRLASSFWNITRSDPDLTEAGVRFGLKQLVDRGIIEATSIETQDGPVAAWTPSSTGWAWLKANQAELPLWKDRPHPDPVPPSDYGGSDDIPF